MVASVTVVAHARLHLGFLDLNGGLGRRFGGLGLAVDSHATRLTLRRAESARVTGPDADRAARHLARLAQQLGVAESYDLTIHDAIPAHAGLGSGTKLALAVAAALRRLEGLELDPAGDALSLQRGLRSGIGIGLFERGGFVVDGGRSDRTTVPPILTRVAFPEDWRVILVCAPHGDGVHGSEEVAAFAGLPPLEASAAAEICRLVLVKALPGLVEGDLDSFADAIARIQEISGDYFAPAQGGDRFSDKGVAAAIAALRARGARGTGQSSWGPTGFAFAPDISEARRLCDAVQAELAASGLDAVICKGLNHGALVKEDSFAAVK
jgi:beta-ribofuranosylaminobenzene 5'-phosphate synthase